MILINGRRTELISVFDRGFQYGDGVFTTIKISRGRALFLDRHLQRLQRDSAQLGIAFPDCALLIGEAIALAEQQETGVLKIILTRGAGGRGYRYDSHANTTRVLSTHSMPKYSECYATDGIVARVCKTRLGHNPSLAGAKHLNRLENIIARQEWDEEFQEGLVLDQDDFLIEGTMSNVFVKMEDRLVTPRLDRCGVNGVMRETLLDIAGVHEIPIEDCRISSTQLMSADEIFLTNSIIGIWPVRTLEGRRLSSIDTGKFFAREVEALASVSGGNS
jgi:4-amino-4-deoxychorismate lyase